MLRLCFPIRSVPLVFNGERVRCFHSCLLLSKRGVDNPYEVLNLTKGSSLADVKKAFSKKAKEYHPDVNKDPKAAEQFQKLNEAYQLLVSKLEAGEPVEIVSEPEPIVVNDKEKIWREKRKREEVVDRKRADREFWVMGGIIISLIVVGSLLIKLVDSLPFDKSVKKRYGEHYEPLLKEYNELLKNTRGN